MDVRNCVDFKEELPVLHFAKAIQDPRQSQVEIIGFYTGRKNRCKKLRGFQRGITCFAFCEAIQNPRRSQVKILDTTPDTKMDVRNCMNLNMNYMF